MTLPLITEEELTQPSGEIDLYSAMGAMLGEIEGIKRQVALSATPAHQSPQKFAKEDVAVYSLLGSVLLVGGLVGYSMMSPPDLAMVERVTQQQQHSQLLMAEALQKKERPSVTCILAIGCPEVPQEPVQQVSQPQRHSIDALYKNPPAIPPEDFQTAITNVARWRQEYTDQQIADFVAQATRDQLGADPMAYQVTLTAFAGVN